MSMLFNFPPLLKLSLDPVLSLLFSRAFFPFIILGFQPLPLYSTFTYTSLQCLYLYSTFTYTFKLAQGSPLNSVFIFQITKPLFPFIATFLERLVFSYYLHFAFSRNCCMILSCTNCAAQTALTNQQVDTKSSEHILAL